MMSKEAVFTMKLEHALRDEFMAAAEETHKPASQLDNGFLVTILNQLNNLMRNGC